GESLDRGGRAAVLRHLPGDEPNGLGRAGVVALVELVALAPNSVPTASHHRNQFEPPSRASIKSRTWRAVRLGSKTYRPREQPAPANCESTSADPVESVLRTRRSTDIRRRLT